MTPEQFVYWLQGHLEISNTKSLNEKELTIVRDHLTLVFNKQTPSRYLNQGGSHSGTTDPNATIFCSSVIGSNGPILGAGPVYVTC